MTFCSLKIHDFFIYAFKIFILSLVYGFFNPFLSLLKFFSYDSLLKLFHFLRSCLLLNISYIIHGVFVFLLTFLTKSLAVSQTDLWIFFHYNCTFLFALSIVEFFFCLWAHNFSISYLGFPFWNRMTFLNPVANRSCVHSQHMSQAVSTSCLLGSMQFKCVRCKSARRQ